MKLKIAIVTYLTSIMAASSAVVVGVNFGLHSSGVPDGAGAQEGANAFGATWTDILSDNLTDQSLNGAPFTMDLAASGWWAGGSWSGSSQEITVFRNYLNDNGISITLEGMSSWLAAEGMTGYTITLYASSDNGTSFLDATIGSMTVPISVGGNGTWDGTSNDPTGNNTGGIRGTGVSGVMTDDVITISLPPNSFPARSSLAAFVVTAVPEPGSALLAISGLGWGFIRRRR